MRVCVSSWIVVVLVRKLAEYLESGLVQLYAILNKGGAITGYLVGEFYLSVEEARFFFKTTRSAKKVYGEWNKKIVGLMARSLPVISCHYECFLLRCESENVQLRDVLFVPCRYADFDLWRHNGIWKLPGCHCYMCVSGQTTLGYLLLDTKLYTSTDIRIVMIEATKKRMGYGSRIVEALKSQGISLCGTSTLEAESFWIKQGAVLHEFNRFRIER